MIFRVYLDNVLVDNPENWQDFEIEYDRNEDLSGLFVKYSNNIKFSGIGYNLIRNKINNDGICSVISVRVESKCTTFDNWSIIFIGVIRCKDVKFESVGMKCFAIVDFEQNNPSAVLSENKDIKVSLFSDYSINNVVPIDFDVHEVYERFVPLNGDAFPEGTALLNNPHGYLVKTVLDQMLMYLTDGQLKLRSDIFDTQPLNDTWNIVFSSDLLINGDIVTISIVDYWQNRITCSFEATANRTNDLIRLSKAIIFASNLLGSCPDPNDQFRMGDSRFMKPFGIANAVPTAGTAVLLTAYSKIQSITSSVTGAGSINITITNPIEYTFGLQDMHIIKGQEFRILEDSAPIEMFFSWQELIDILNAAFSLEYQFEYDADEDQWYIRLEPKAYFFSTSTAVFNFVNVPDVEESYDEKRIRTGMELGQNYQEDTWYLPGLYSLISNTVWGFINKFMFEDTQKTFEAYNFRECAQGVYRKVYENGYSFPQGGQINHMSTPQNTTVSTWQQIFERVFFMDCKLQLSFPPEQQFRQFIYQRCFLDGGVYVLEDNHIYNANYTAWHFLQWHYFGLASPITIRPKGMTAILNPAETVMTYSSSTSPAQPLIVDENNNFLRIVKFMYPMTPDFFEEANSTTFSKAKVRFEGVDAYIRNIKYTLYNGMAEVELMVNMN